MTVLQEMISGGFKVVGVGSYETITHIINGISTNRHLQVVYLQKGDDIGAVNEFSDKNGNIGWKKTDL